jgi:MYXO-CTERM domain-containing protein
VSLRQTHAKTKKRACVPKAPARTPIRSAPVDNPCEDQDAASCYEGDCADSEDVCTPSSDGCACEPVSDQCEDQEAGMCTEGTCDEPNTVCTPDANGCSCESMVVQCGAAESGMCADGVCENPTELCLPTANACGCRPEPGALKLSGGGVTSCSAAATPMGGAAFMFIVMLGAYLPRRRRNA